MKKPTVAFFGCLADEAPAIRTAASSAGVEPILIPENPSETNAALARGCRCVSVGHRRKITEQVLAALREAGVEYLVTRSIGMNHIDLSAAEKLGITVENIHYAPDGVADYTVMLILMALQGGKETVLAGARRDFRIHGPRRRELKNLTVGILGTGRIGMTVARRLEVFGCRILACDPHPAEGLTYVSLDALLTSSDILTLHLPLTEQTRHIIGRKQLSMMKRDAILVNTARGGLVDTAALREALSSHRLGGAALDVLEEEDSLFYRRHSVLPPEMQDLLDQPNLILSPHAAYYTREILGETVQKAIESCLSYQRRQTP